MNQERSPEENNDSEFVKSIFERGSKATGAAKKISALFGGGAAKERKEEKFVADEKAPQEFLPIGVDIGSAEIKAVQVSRTAGRLRLVKLARGRPNEIRELLRQNNFKGDAVLGLCVKDVYIRCLSLPPMPLSEVEAALKWELAEALGVNARNIEEFCFDYTVLSEEASAAVTRKVLVAAVRRDLVLEKTQQAAQAGMNVLAVEPSVFALFAAFCNFSTQEANKITLLLNLENEGSCLVVAFGQEIYMVQSINATASLLKDAVSENGTIANLPAAASAIENLIIDIEHSYKSVSNQVGAEASRLILCGEGANIKGLDIFLRGRLNIFVEIFNPLNNFIIGDDVAMMSGLTQLGTSLGAAVGLALRGRG